MNFQDIWQIFSTGKGKIYGVDAISLSAIFRIAEQELKGEFFQAQSARREFLKYEPQVMDCYFTATQLDELVEEIKCNTIFNQSIVYNSDGRRRYENLTDVGFMMTEDGFKTVILSDSI